jgi:hypothetical protein
MRLTLSQRLGTVFAVLLVTCCAASVWLQARSSVLQQDELTQRLSLGLAAHIAGNSALMERGDLNAPAVKDLFGKLMAVNPSVEVYLLGLDGTIEAQDAPRGTFAPTGSTGTPSASLLAGHALPMQGDDPREPAVRKVFSAAPLPGRRRDAGYVYVVLFGEDRDTLAAHAGGHNAVRAAMWAMALVALLALVAGLAAFRLITAPLRELTQAVRDCETEGSPALQVAGPRWAAKAAARNRGLAARPSRRHDAAHRRAVARADGAGPAAPRAVRQHLARPAHAAHVAARLPGNAVLKDDRLSDVDRRRYLHVALGQSREGRAAGAGSVRAGAPGVRRGQARARGFGWPDLVQDVFQKFELACEARTSGWWPTSPAPCRPCGRPRHDRERADQPAGQRGIRHTPEGGEIVVQLRAENAGVTVQVSDTGPGIPGELQKALFMRPVFIGSRTDVPAAGDWA